MDDLVLELAQAMCDTENKRRARAVLDWPELLVAAYVRDATAAAPVIEARVAAERERIEAEYVKVGLWCEVCEADDLTCSFGHGDPDTGLAAIFTGCDPQPVYRRIVRSDGVTDDE